MSSTGMIYEHSPRNLAVATCPQSADLFTDDCAEAAVCSPLLLLWTFGAAALNLFLIYYIVLWLL